MLILAKILNNETMEDLNKNAKTEKPVEVQNDSIKKVAGSSEVNPPKVPVKRIRVRAKPNPAPKVLTKSTPAPVAAVVVSTPEVQASKAAKPVSKKVKKTEEKVVVKKTPIKGKAESEPMVQNVVSVDSKDETTKPELDKKGVKAIKKKAKEIGKKVDKLKKKVKKAKKKEVKKSKIKVLKEKLDNALEKFKDKVEKLKEVKKTD